MVAADTSTIAAYLGGHSGGDVEALDRSLADGSLVAPPIVITELLARPRLEPEAIRLFLELRRLEISDGYFERAGELRRNLRERGLRARLADALICQSCLDHGAPLITRDRDFRHFAAHTGLKLVAPLPR